MKLLLDTHAFLWFLREPDKLSSLARTEIETAGRDAAVSIASLWEIAIKVSLNKLALPKEFKELFPQAITDSGLSLLIIEPHHLAAVRTFRGITEIHSIACSSRKLQVKGLRLVSRDSHLAS